MARHMDAGKGRGSPGWTPDQAGGLAPV